MKKFCQNLLTEKSEKISCNLKNVWYNVDTTSKREREKRMNPNYFQPTFEQMNTSTIQLWLREAQWQLPNSTGAVHDILCEGIKAAATELLFRFRNESKRA
jgi:hypothetical protein